MLLQRYGVELVVLTGNPWVEDSRNPHVKYSVTDRKNHEPYFRELDEALSFARACDARNVLLDTGDSFAGMTGEEMMANAIEVLGRAADKVRESGIGVLI